MNRTTPKRSSAGAAPRPSLYRQRLSRRERETRLRRVVIATTAVVLALVVIIPLAGYYREVLTKGAQPVAYVNGEAVTLDAFAKVYALRLDNLERNIAQMRSLSGQTTSAASGGNIFAQQIQRLEAQRESLDQTVLAEMVEDRLIAVEAAQRGIVVSSEDVDAQLREQFADPATPTPDPATPSPTPASAPTTTPVPTIDPLERFRNAFANQKVLSEQEYRDLVVRPGLVRERLRAAIATDVPTSEAQVHARHILLESEEAANTARARLTAGETFEKVAAELSKDNANKDQGGDLGWFGRGKMAQPFEEAAFKLPVGQVSAPIQSPFGWHLIEVLAADPTRQLAETEINEKRESTFREWLDRARDEAFSREAVEYDLSDDEVTWAKNLLNKARDLPTER